MKRDNTLLVVLALLTRSVFLIYRAFIWVLPWGLLATLVWLPFAGFSPYWAAAGVIALVLYCAYRLYAYADDSLPESAGAGSLAERLSSRFVAWIGTLKFFRMPPCIVEDPGGYKISGRQLREVLDCIEPGDLLLRGYDGYLDGELIRMTGGADGDSRYFSHAALYVGQLDSKVDREVVARRLRVLRDGRWCEANPDEMEAVRNNKRYFETGSQMVVHAMAKGVHAEDILTFLRCDHLAVLRLPDSVSLDESALKNAPLVTLADESEEIDRRLRNGETLSRQVIADAAKRSALGQIGSGYDFLFQHGSTFNRFSCSEFVYYCYKSVHRLIGLQRKPHAILKYFFRRETVSPADIYGAIAPAGRLILVWPKTSESPTKARPGAGALRVESGK